MKVRFFSVHGGRTVDATYGFGDARVPVEGETIAADGSDPAFPRGEYRVQWVRWEIGVRGPRTANVYLLWLDAGAPA